MSAAARKKAKELMAMALDERNNSEHERIRMAFSALKVIEKYHLLDSPLDGIMETDNETVKAAATIFDHLTNPDLVNSVKKVAGGLRRSRRRYT